MSLPAAERLMAADTFFEHLGLLGGFLLVAWHDVRDRLPRPRRELPPY